MMRYAWKDTKMNDRRLTTTVQISDRIELQLSTSHDKNRKHYVTKMTRSEIDGFFRTVSIMGDIVTINREPAARYSAKKLGELHEQWKPAIELDKWHTWAAEKKLSN